MAAVAAGQDRTGQDRPTGMNRQMKQTQGPQRFAFSVPIKSKPLIKLIGIKLQYNFMKNLTIHTIFNVQSLQKRGKGGKGIGFFAIQAIKKHHRNL